MAHIYTYSFITEIFKNRLKTKATPRKQKDRSDMYPESWTHKFMS